MSCNKSWGGLSVIQIAVPIGEPDEVVLHRVVLEFPYEWPPKIGGVIVTAMIIVSIAAVPAAFFLGIAWRVFCASAGIDQ